MANFPRSKLEGWKLIIFLVLHSLLIRPAGRRGPGCRDPWKHASGSPTGRGEGCPRLPPWGSCATSWKGKVRAACSLPALPLQPVALAFLVLQAESPGPFSCDLSGGGSGHAGLCPSWTSAPTAIGSSGQRCTCSTGGDGRCPPTPTGLDSPETDRLGETYRGWQEC